MNRVTLIGNIGADAELKITPSGGAVLKFTLATSERWTDKSTGEKKDKTEWHRCVSFQKSAEKLAQYLVKGTKIAVEGAMTYGKYEKDGVTHYTADVKVQNIEFVGSKGGGKPVETNGAPLSEDFGSGSDDSEIPF